MFSIQRFISILSRPVPLPKRGVLFGFLLTTLMMKATGLHKLVSLLFVLTGITSQAFGQIATEGFPLAMATHISDLPLYRGQPNPKMGKVDSLLWTINDQAATNLRLELALKAEQHKRREAETLAFNAQEALAKSCNISPDSLFLRIQQQAQYIRHLEQLLKQKEQHIQTLGKRVDAAEFEAVRLLQEKITPMQ